MLLLVANRPPTANDANPIAAIRPAHDRQKVMVPATAIPSRTIASQ
jgi:hypothetical protein